jgi:hypothetical protein
MSTGGDPAATKAGSFHSCAGKYGPLGSDEPRRAVLFLGQPTLSGTPTQRSRGGSLQAPTSFDVQADEVIW